MGGMQLLGPRLLDVPPLSPPISVCFSVYVCVKISSYKDTNPIDEGSILPESQTKRLGTALILV